MVIIYSSMDALVVLGQEMNVEFVVVLDLQKNVDVMILKKALVIVWEHYLMIVVSALEIIQIKTYVVYVMEIILPALDVWILIILSLTKML